MESYCLEKEGSALSILFQKIISDLKNYAPLWEDFACKASKLHSGLRTALQAISAYLEAFQKIADAATCARGATKDIGSALTRICLRHRAVEARVKTFTNAIMDSLVIPLQEKLEEWKKGVINLEKEHLKEFKRGRSDLKKFSTDTIRLQKKAKKGNSGDIQSRVESCLQDVTECKQSLTEVERRAVREALTEERSRFCQFYDLLEPVVLQEMAVLGELSHLQDATEQLRRLTANPRDLPASSEQVVIDTKFLSPPSSPQSLGSRKSSACSINSLNSNSSSGCISPALSPGQTHWQRNVSQVSNISNCASGVSTTTSLFNNSSMNTISDYLNERPHTISAAFERGHQRPHLTVYTFQTLDQSLSQPASPSSSTVSNNTLNRPPLPIRCSSLERPKLPNKNVSGNVNTAEKSRPSPLPVHLVKELGQPTYVNMYDIATISANKTQFMLEASSDSSAESSSGYGSHATSSPQLRSTSSICDSSQEVYTQHTAPHRRCSSSLKPSPPTRRTSISTVYRTENVTQAAEMSDTESSNNGYNNTISKGIYSSTTSVPTGAVAGTIKALTESKHTPASPGALRRINPAIMQKQTLLTSNTAFSTRPYSYDSQKTNRAPENLSSNFEKLELNQETNLYKIIPNNSCAANAYATNVTCSNEARSSLSHIVPVECNEIYSTPKVLSTFSSDMCSHKTNPLINATRKNENITKKFSEMRNDNDSMNPGFLTQLTAKLAPQFSPASPRKILSEGQDSIPTKTNKSDKMPPVLQRGSHDFIEQLNAKLAQQQIINVGTRANTVQKIINNTVQPDPSICHESLMEQIKRGAKLKRNRTVNDRSAPKIH